MILTCKGLKDFVKQIITLLLENQLLTTKQIVFLVYGAKNLKKIIESTYFYTNFTVVLDWYHAKKNIRTSLNSGLRCKEEDKEKYVSKVISK